MLRDTVELIVVEMGCRWMEMAADGWRWLQIDIEGCTWMEKASHERRWLQIEGDECRWMEMVADGWRWF